MISICGVTVCCAYPSQIIPLKNNGKFDARLGLGKNEYTMHYIRIDVVGYVDRFGVSCPIVRNARDMQGLPRTLSARTRPLPVRTRVLCRHYSVSSFCVCGFDERR